MSVATVTSKGQVTIPKPVREALEIHAGDRLSFNVRADGTLEVHLVTGDLRKLQGMLEAPKPVSLDDMDSAIAAGAADE